MSLMHQALDRPATPGQVRRNGYNPLHRKAPRNGMFWWIITGLALLAALALLAWPRWRPEAELPVSALVQAPPAEASLATPAAANTDAVTADRYGPELTAVKPASVTGASEAHRPEPASPGENQPQVLAPSEPEPEALTRASPEQPAPNEPREQTMAVAQRPVTEPPTPTEALPAPADNPGNAPGTTADANPSNAAAPDNRSGSSVATAVPQHDAARRAVQSAIGQGDLAQAQQLLQSWINREPALEEPRIWLAKVYLSRGARQEAETLLVGLGSAEALGLRGLVLEQTERYADAARIFEALTRKEASNPQWWLHWAINLENSGRLAEARLLYQTYLEQFSSHNERLTAFATERYRALAG